MGRKYAILQPVWEVKGAVERRKKKEERTGIEHGYLG